MATPQELFISAVELIKSEKLPEAAELLTNCLLLEPKVAHAWDNRGSVLQKLGHPFDAILNYDKAIELMPEEGSFYNNRGTAYLAQSEYDKALADFKRATELNPKIAECHNNYGNTLMRLNKPHEAIDCYRQAIRVRPDYADAHLGLSLALLKDNQLEEGWKEYEWRWRNQQMHPRNLKIADWGGEQAKSQDDGLLLYGEQGYGDDLQFMRYAALAKKLAWKGKVYLELRQPLVRLAETMEGIDGVISMGSKFPDNVVACAPLLSCPHLMWSKIPGVPQFKPYFRPDPFRVSIWRDRLKQLPKGLKVGICWAGMNRDRNPTASAIDFRRSMDLQQFKPLCLKGVSWASLQLGPKAEQMRTPPTGMTGLDYTIELYDFYDTAALIEACDLVITVDTAVCHVAGALGKPVWMLSRFDGCWRWLKDREDTPWYPTMRIFNQKEEGNWVEVIERMVPELEREIRSYEARVAA